jgi:hypothetical protein
MIQTVIVLHFFFVKTTQPSQNGEKILDKLIHYMLTAKTGQWPSGVLSVHITSYLTTPPGHRLSVLGNDFSHLQLKIFHTKIYTGSCSKNMNK